MKKVGFIGGADKTSLITYVAKTLEDLGKTVLVIDATTTQRIKYILPAITPTKSYIIDFENVDYAIGFESIKEIERYLGIKDEEEEIQNWPYDYILIDIDTAKAITDFRINDTQENYFVTSFDIYSLIRGTDILKELPFTMNLSKILLNYDMRQEDEEYLNFLTVNAKVVWNKFSIFLPITTENQEIIEENQRVYKARLKKLAPEYQEAIIYIVQDIVKDVNINTIKKKIRE